MPHERTDRRAGCLPPSEQARSSDPPESRPAADPGDPSLSASAKSHAYVSHRSPLDSQGAVVSRRNGRPARCRPARCRLLTRTPAHMRATCPCPHWQPARRPVEGPSCPGGTGQAARPLRRLLASKAEGRAAGCRREGGFGSGAFGALMRSLPRLPASGCLAGPVGLA
jgi:hypothetical protein